VASANVVIRRVSPAAHLRGDIVLPGDKSISHRYALLGALADGTTRITHYAPGRDCAATLACLARLGVTIEQPDAGTVILLGRGLGGLRSPGGELDAMNSGSTMRMLAGIVAGHPFETRITGDDSLRRRPMRRIITPLERMGARVEHREGRPPLAIHGCSPLRAIEFVPEVASAQVKSAVLFAGLHAGGETTVTEPARTRDHTERALVAFGVRPEINGLAVTVRGGTRLTGASLRVPGDASSGAFWAVAAAALPGAEVVLRDMGTNPTRTAYLDVLERAGARITRIGERLEGGEPVGTVTVAHGSLRAVEITPDEVPGLIDELPVLAALATFGGGLRVTGAAELRGKESDRITALVQGLRTLGADADELADGYVVRPSRKLRGGRVDACGDHRLAMAFAVAGLGADGPTEIIGANAADVSYPGFFDTLEALCAEGR
jgi:3-phosphoshikimate 1-carboxyvinyltransferase